MRDVAHPSHPGRGGGDAPASRPGRPGRSGAGTIRPGPSPGGADGQRDPPPPRSRGPCRARGLDAASGRPCVDPAAAVGPFRDSSRNPTTMMAAGSSPRWVVEDLGRFRRAQQPDSDASTHRRTDWTGRSPPPRWMRRCSALTRTPGRRRPPLPSGNPFPTRASRSSALGRPIPACPSAVTASAPRPGCPLRHPVTRPPTACATGPYDPAASATGPDPGRSRERPAPQTLHRIPAPTRPNPTSITSPTARKTPNTPNHLPGSALGLRNPTHHSAKNLFEAGRLRPQPHPRCEEPSIVSGQTSFRFQWHTHAGSPNTEQALCVNLNGDTLSQSADPEISCAYWIGPEDMTINPSLEDLS